MRAAPGIRRGASAAAGARRASEADRAMASRRGTGSPKYTTVLRPLTSTLSILRKRPTSTQFSANNSRQRLCSFCGARPQKIDTGTRSTSNPGSAAAESTKCTRWRGRARAAAQAQERALASQREASLRARQAEPRARVVEHGEIGMALVLEHVAHRPRARRECFGDVVGLDGRLDPQSQSLAHGPAPGSDQAANGAHDVCSGCCAISAGSRRALERLCCAGCCRLADRRFVEHRAPSPVLGQRIETVFRGGAGGVSGGCADEEHP